MSATTEPKDPAIIEVTSDVTADSAQPSTSSDSVNSSTIKDGMTTALNEATTSKEHIEPYSDENPTTSTSSNENSQNRNDDLDTIKDDDEDEDEDEDYEDDEDDDDSDPDFPKFDDTPKGRIVGPVAGQKPKPKPK